MRGGAGASTRRALAALALIVAAPAAAQEAGGQDEPRFCPTRPSIGTSPCTTEPGHVHLEMSALDWQRDDSSDMREDRVLAADLLVRVGIGAKTEVQVGWTGFGHDRQRDKASNGIDTVNGTGDVTLGLRQHLVGPQDDGKGFSAALQPFVTVPVGRYPVGAGDWGAGLVVPLQYAVSNDVALQFTGTAEAAVNQSGDGRHLAYNGVLGIDYKLTKVIDLTGEVQLERDRDPAGHETHAIASGSIAWKLTKRSQLDVQAAAGLNRTSPDLRLIVGGAVLF